MAITTDDFNKIWASTSPLTPYSFSASQYKEGWNFIGSTPPPRQMWDFLQKNNDEKMQYLLNNFDKYLPLSGGTLTGDVDITGDLSVSGDLDVRSESVAPVNTLQRSTAYSVDDIVYTSALNAKYYLLCVTAGITSATMPSFSGAGSNTEVTDGTVVWRVQTITSQESVDSKSGLPVGFEAFTTNPTLQAGWLPLLGGEYSRTTYADLWAWVQTQQGYLIEESAWQAKAAANGGNVPFYSKGDGSTTFRVPALKCWVRGANSINEVGGYLAAGLPNITGGFGLRPVDGGRNVTWETNNGAIKVATQTGDSSICVASSSSKAPLMNVTIDASRSSAIYGKSDTVQPESIVGMWVVKAYGTVTNVGSTDVANISTGLTQAETRISALENHVQLPGVVQAFAGSTIPTGWLLCDGSAVSRTTYASLYACIGTTYGSGDGSTTFNLPNLTDKFIQGSATAGTVKSAGLPNIVAGTITTQDWGGIETQMTGAWVETSHNKEAANVDRGTSADEFVFTFNASHSNSIYGNSTTVQPPALTMRYIIKY